MNFAHGKYSPVKDCESVHIASKWQMARRKINLYATCHVPRATRGFTLVELLIVITIIGVLSTIVVSAINPTEQLHRARDSRRQQEVNRLAKALAAYSINNNSQYPLVAGWANTLITANEINSLPSDTVPGAVGECTQNVISAAKAYCYVNNSNSVIVYTVLQSKSNNRSCAPSEKAYFLWSSAKEQVTKDCDSADPPTP